MKNIIVLILLTVVCSCSNTPETLNNDSSCTGCHQMALDKSHQLSCVQCHNGNKDSHEQESAHVGLITKPAHPKSMQRTCGPCHSSLIPSIERTSHFTLRNMTNLVRQAFGATENLESFLQTVGVEDIDNKLQLADDLLRRRCFRCHVFSSGDDFPAVKHGTGCAACHLQYFDSQLKSHQFTKPSDAQCLSCHYGNYVGFDYYGYFEQDYHKEYRTPFPASGTANPPYGIEFHLLVPDVHRQQGMQCIDCHSGDELMGDGPKPSCAGCHDRAVLKARLPVRVTLKNGGYTFQDSTGELHPLPLLQHPVHQKYKTVAECQSCHAQWTFNDGTSHFFREDTDDFDRWEPYTVQGNREIQILLQNNTNFDKPELPNEMQDMISGEKVEGIWLKGYTERRWEGLPLGRNSQGRIAPVRRILDMRLTWVDDDEAVRFDSVSSENTTGGFLPYVPHTTGPAGAYSEERIADYLFRESKSKSPRTLQ